MGESGQGPIDGVLNVLKPKGPTSRDVVNQIQSCVRPCKVGHAGTLDPLATGVLVICIGRATRLIEYVQRMRKRYRAAFRFGWRSDSDDLEGQLEQVAGPRPTRDALIEALTRFRGEIDQVPPAYSAVKVRGQRAYHLARNQQPLALTARRVTVWRLELVEYTYPDWTVDVECGSGTYIRALGRDLAGALGTSAVMSALERTAIGSFTVDQSVDVARWNRALVIDHLHPLEVAVGDMPRVTVTSDEARQLAYGRSIPVSTSAPVAPGSAPVEVAAMREDGSLIAILERRADAWHPSRYLAGGPREGDLE